jgi:hypothetical protein
MKRNIWRKYQYASIGKQLDDDERFSSYLLIRKEKEIQFQNPIMEKIRFSQFIES